MSDSAATLGVPRPDRDTHSPSERSGARHSAHGSLLPFSPFKAAQLGHRALAWGQERGDATPAQIAGSGTWSTSSFPDALPPAAAASFMCH